MDAIAPEGVVKIIQATISFMNVTLLGENLSPSTEMERQDTVDRLESLVEKLNKVKSTGFQATPPPKRPRKPEKKQSPKEPKESHPPDKDRSASTGSSYMDMNTTEVLTLSTTNSNLSETTNSSHKESNDVTDNASLSHEDISEENYEVAVDANLSHVCIVEENYEVAGAVASEYASKDVALEDALQEKLKSLQKCTIAELKEGAVYTGYLMKHKRRLLTKWHRRFCIIKDNFLFYCKSEMDLKEQGVITLPGYNFVSKEKGYLFNLEPCDKSKDAYSFQTDHQEEFEQWRIHLMAITSKTMNSEQTGLLNTVVLENYEDNSVDGSGSGKVKDLCQDIYDDVAEQPAAPLERQTTGDAMDKQRESITEEIYDDVAESPSPITIEKCVPNTQSNDAQSSAIQETFYDDIVVHSMGQVTAELYDDIAQPSLNQDISLNHNTSVAPDEMYELIPAQQQTPLPIPKRSIIAPASDVPHPAPARRPSMPIPARNSIKVKSAQASTQVNDQFFIGNVFMGLYSCTSEHPDDLSFNRGDIMYILDKIDVNWWLGYHNGKVGLVPSNFLTDAFV